jgi:TRAP transporter 4TM/12TM fusion protein
VDIVVGVIVVALVFEAGRRMMGPMLPIICAIFLSYGLFGQYLPSPLQTRGYDFYQVVDQMFLGTEGIYGTPIYVSSTYIFLFILFGAFLERAGMISLFTDLAMGTVGHARGGPAKVAVISSRLMGTINGSGIANVVTVGQFTIPLMKRFGYPAYFAGAVEAIPSMGGQIMPPVMGAVAFIMAETINVPYSAVCIAAVVPAVLYYYSAFWAVHLEAGKRGLVGLPKGPMPERHPGVAQELAPADAACGSGGAALRRLCAPVRRDRRPGPHGDGHFQQPNRGRDPRCRPAHRVLDPARALSSAVL